MGEEQRTEPRARGEDRQGGGGGGGGGGHQALPPHGNRAGQNLLFSPLRVFVVDFVFVVRTLIRVRSASVNYIRRPPPPQLRVSV